MMYTMYRMVQCAKAKLRLTLRGVTQALYVEYALWKRKSQPLHKDVMQMRRVNSASSAKGSSTSVSFVPAGARVRDQ